MNAMIVKGSLAEVAQQNNGALIAPPVAVVLVDISWSMDADDAQDERGRPATRWAAAKAALERLQGEMPGQVALIAFGDTAVMCPDGVLPPTLGTTRLHEALAMARQADSGSMRFVVISDGLPDDSDAAMAEARRFTGAVDCVYVGTDCDGERFLKRMAQATGGQFHRDASGLRLLDQTVRLMLAAGEGSQPISL